MHPDRFIYGVCLLIAQQEFDAAQARLDAAEDELADALQAAHDAAELVEHACRAYAREADQ